MYDLGLGHSSQGSLGFTGFGGVGCFGSGFFGSGGVGFGGVGFGSSCGSTAGGVLLSLFISPMLKDSKLYISVVTFSSNAILGHEPHQLPTWSVLLYVLCRPPTLPSLLTQNLA